MPKRKVSKSDGIPRKTELTKSGEARRIGKETNYLALFLLLIALAANIVAFFVLL